MGRRFLSAPDIPVLSSPPDNPSEGSVYWDLTSATLRIYRGGTWVTVGPTTGGGNSGPPMDLPGLPRPGPLPGDSNPVVPFVVGSAASTTLANSTNVARWIPWAVRAPLRITSVSIAVTTAATGTAQIGIYDSSPTRPYAPTTRLYLITGIDTGTTGTKTTSGLAWDLQPGLYWFAVWTSAGPTLRAIALNNLFALSVVMSSTGVNTSYTTTITGGLPDPAPTSGYTAVAAAYPAIGVLYTLL